MAELGARCMLFLCLPIICILNLMFASNFLNESEKGMNDFIIIFVCSTFCLHIMFTACCSVERNMTEDH